MSNWEEIKLEEGAGEIPLRLFRSKRSGFRICKEQKRKGRVVFFVFFLLSSSFAVIF
jgi:hypothetical protein